MTEQAVERDYLEEITKGPLAFEGDAVLTLAKAANKRRSDLLSALDSVREAVNAFNTARHKLFEERLRAAGKGWCTRHQGVVQLGDLRLLYISDSSDRRPSSVIHRACRECFERDRERSGYRGNGGETYFLAFKVEERGDELFYSKFGEWVSVKEATVAQLEPAVPEYIPEEVAREFGIPPQIHWPSGLVEEVKLLADNNEVKIGP